MHPASLLDLSGYRVAIAGGSKGIGRAMVLAFIAAGASVSTCARGAASLASLRDDAAGGKLSTHRCDLADAAAVPAWIEAAAEALGGIDVLVNNASGYGFEDTDDAWEADFNVDMMAAVRASRAALPWLKASDHASIVHTSSIAALAPRPANAPYGAIKAALRHYATSQALRLAKYGIRVNAIAPGSIEFPDGIWDRCKRERPDQYAATLARIPFGRFGTPEEIARTVVFLASPLASWITGQTLCVDGGQTLNG